jgi:hypothetical protein
MVVEDEMVRVTKRLISFTIQVEPQAFVEMGVVKWFLLDEAEVKVYMVCIYVTFSRLYADNIFSYNTKNLLYTEYNMLCECPGIRLFAECILSDTRQRSNTRLAKGSTGALFTECLFDKR